MCKIRFLGFLLVFFAALLALFGAPDETWSAPATQTDEVPPSYQQVAENERFRLFVEFDTLAFKLLDKRSGYVWHSGLDELREGDRLNRAWQAFARSGVSIEYLDARAINRRVSLTNAEHTLEITPIEQGISVQVTFLEFGISLRLILQLEAEGVRVEVPSNSIREEKPEFKLGLIYLYPFLGATRGSQTPGYMLIPDGVGSLIRFADTTKARNMFYGRYYGPDLGMIAALPFDPELRRPYPIAYPVFGMVHGEGENAFLSIVEQGAAYGEIQAHPAGILTNFNFIYNAFIYNESYYQATNRAGAGVTVVQRRTNEFDVVVHFRFLTGEEADYVGMARSYQRYLVEKGLLRKVPITNPNIGIRLEFLGGDKEQILLWSRFVPMTTLAEMEEILADLQIDNAEVVYYGWQPLGASSMPPTALRLERSLGDVAELRALAERIVAKGGHFSLYLDPQAALRDEAGYSPRNDLAIAITNVSLVGHNRNRVVFYFTFDALRRRLDALQRAVAAYPPIGLALDQVGWMLYSDFRSGRSQNRAQAVEGYRALLAESPVRLVLYRPNDYLFSAAEAYFDMPLGNNGYVYTSEAVPFLPIVLAGHLPYYGEALNFSANLQEDLLRHVDYGIYPSYFLTQQATTAMLNTRSNWIFTSSYAQWGEHIRQTYRWMNELLGPVRGQEIVARHQLAEGVFATTYANGRQIIVNYTGRPFFYQGVTVEARNAFLLEGAP